MIKNAFLLAVAIRSLFLAQAATAEVVYSADFSLNGQGSTHDNGGDGYESSPVPGSNWQLIFDPSGLATDGSQNEFITVGGVMRVQDWGGDGTVISDPISVPGNGTVDIEGAALSIGSDSFNNVGTEGIAWFYQINSEPVVSVYYGESELGGPVASGTDVGHVFSDIPVNSGDVLKAGFTVNVNGSGDGVEVSALTVEFSGDSSMGVAVPASFTANSGGAGLIDLSWVVNSNADPVVIARSASGVFGSPDNGSVYAVNDLLNGGGKVVYTGSGSLFMDSGLEVDGEYFYRIWSVDASTNYSAGVEARALAAQYQEGLHIIHVNDVHSRLTPHDYDITGTNDVKELEQVGGMAYMATKILEFKQANPGALILDAGDISEGSVLGDLRYNGGFIDCYNKLHEKLLALGGRGIDASVVGNHDMRHVDMVTNMRAADFPFISMNIVSNDTADLVFPPYVTVVADGKKVGILGYTTDTSTHLEETTEPLFDVLTCSWNHEDTDIHIKDYVDELRNDEHCDVVILLMHVGHSRAASDASYARQLVEDDGETEPPEVAIAGHWHTMTETVWQPSDIGHKMIIAESASYCQYVGQIELTDKGRYLNAWKTPVRCADIIPDPDVAAVIDDLKTEYALNPHTHYSDTNITYALDQVIGYSAVPLLLNKDKWFTHAEFPWAGDNSAGAWVADSMQWYIDTQTPEGCDLALQSGGGVRRDNDAGPVTYLELYETYPWQDDNMVLIEATGAEIWAFIEEDNCGTSISQGWTVYADDGIIYKIEKDGVPISPTDTFNVAVSKYMYSHDNNFVSGGWSDPTPVEYNYSIRQSMIDYTSQFSSPSNAMPVADGRYVLNTGSAGRFRAVVTMVDDDNREPYFESAYIRLLSATDDTVARRGSYVDENLVNEDGSINVTNRLAEVMLYRSYLGFEKDKLINGTVLDVQGEFGFFNGNPQFVDQNGIVSDGVEFRIVGTNTALALPEFKGSISGFWDEWHENHYVQVEGVKTGSSSFTDRLGTEITVYTEGGFDTAALPGGVGEMLRLSGVQTMRDGERRFRVAEAEVVGPVDYTPVSAVVQVTPMLQTNATLLLTAEASDTASISSASLLPVDDTYVLSGPTSWTNGTKTALYIQSSTNYYGNERAWLKFDLSGLPAGVSIDSATLRMYCYDTYFASADLDVAVHGSADDSWQEENLNWTGQPAVGTLLDSTVLSAGSEYVWYDWDVTSFIAGEFAGDLTASLLAKAVTEDAAIGGNAYLFDSKEYQSGSKGPFLDIAFSGAVPVGGSVTNLDFYYAYSADGLSWGPWMFAGSKTAEPWNLLFSYPDGEGYYRFYSIATDDAGQIEPAPVLADASVHFTTDSDMDGIGDAWERLYFGNLTSVDETSDRDNDGFPDLHEYLAGTVPTNSQDLLAVDMQDMPHPGTNHVVIIWPSVFNKTYALQSAEDLAGGFTNILTGIEATPPQNSVTTSVGSAVSRFYKVQLEH